MRVIHGQPKTKNNTRQQFSDKLYVIKFSTFLLQKLKVRVGFDMKTAFNCIFICHQVLYI